EVVEITYDPEKISLRELVVMALEAHDPTQGFRQGNDVGTQYRSAFYPRTQEELELIQELVDSYDKKLAENGFGGMTTEVKLLSDTDSGEYYLAEDEHQQYLYKVPNGYCPHHSTGVKCDSFVPISWGDRVSTSPRAALAAESVVLVTGIRAPNPSTRRFLRSSCARVRRGRLKS